MIPSLLCQIHVLQVHWVDEHGGARLRKTLTRRKVLEFFTQLPEACGGAHYRGGGKLTKFGHTVKLMTARFVIPYCKRRNDAKAICEAVGWPNVHFVAIKTKSSKRC